MFTGNQKCPFEFYPELIKRFRQGNAYSVNPELVYASKSRDELRKIYQALVELH
jgi:hypothetical protein